MPHHRSAFRSCVALLLVALASACGGGDGEPGTGPVPVPELRLSDTTATGMTMLVAHLRDGGAAGSITATVDTASTSVVVIDDSTLAVPVPVLPAGRYQLTLRVGGRTVTAPLRVAAAPAVPDAAAYVESILTGLGQSLDRQAALFADTATRPVGIDSAAFAQGLQRTRAAVADIRGEFAALSEADQRAVAVALRANTGALGIDSLLAGVAGAPAFARTSLRGTVPSALLLATTRGACLGGQSCVDVTFQFVEFARDVTIAYIGVSGAVAVGSWLGGPGAKLVGKIATVGLGAAFLYYQYSILTDQLNTPVAVEQVKDPYDEALGIELRAAPTRASLATSGRLALRASVPRQLTVRGEYRSLVAGDAATMPAVAMIRDALDGLRPYWNKAAASIPGFPLAAPALASTTRRRAEDVILPQFLRVADVTLAGTTATTSAIGNALAVTLVNERMGDDHELAFDLRYVAPGMATRTVTVPALLYPRTYRVMQLGIVPEETPVGVRKGGTRQLQRVAVDSSGDDIADSLLVGRTTTWTTSRAAKATVSGAGLVTGVDTGTVTISATLDGRRADRSVKVSGGLTVKFETAGHDFYGTYTVIDDRTFRLSCTPSYSFEAYDPTGTTADPAYVRVIGYDYRFVDPMTNAVMIREHKDIPVDQQFEVDGNRFVEMTWFWIYSGTPSTNRNTFWVYLTMQYRDLRDGLVYTTPEASTHCPDR